MAELFCVLFRLVVCLSSSDIVVCPQPTSVARQFYKGGPRWRGEAVSRGNSAIDFGAVVVP